MAHMLCKMGSVGELGRARDSKGREVVLLSRIWEEKVLVDHPEMRGHHGAVLATVTAPEHVELDPGSDRRVRYYRREAGPSQWLLVVVSYEQEPARVISAFGNRKDPRTWSA